MLVPVHITYMWYTNCNAFVSQIENTWSFCACLLINFGFFILMSIFQNVKQLFSFTKYIKLRVSLVMHVLAINTYY